jgi:hypothetical protein
LNAKNASVILICKALKAAAAVEVVVVVVCRW